jgi:hypothetical protein
MAIRTVTGRGSHRSGNPERRVRGLTRGVKRAAAAADAAVVRTPSFLAAALVLLSGCGGGPPEGEAANMALVRDTVLSWHTLQADRDARACELVTSDAVERMLAFERKTATAIGTPAPEDCEAMIAGRPNSEEYRTLMLNTIVDVVRVDGVRATATAHTSATLRGVVRTTQPVPIPLRWDGGRWRVD